MKDYLNDDGDEVSMNAADIEKDWNNTFANLQKFTIEKGDDGPGFGLVLAVAAATVAAFAVRRRR
jgi:PGF-CTERM protein